MVLSDLPVDPAAVAAGVRVDVDGLLALRRAGERLPLGAVRSRARQTGILTSPFKGRGMEFEESRPYQPGDDLRSLDWRVTARTGRPFTKLFREERERPVLLCVDYRRGMHFATRGAFKSVVAARAAAALAWSALDHGDRIGGIVYSEREHRELRPQRGKAAVLHMIAALVQHSAWLDGQQNAADPLALRTALIRMRRVARPGSLVFVLSDFRDLGAPGCEEALGRIASHSEVALVMLHDPLERELPPPDLYRLRDGEASVLLDTRQQAQVAAHRARFAARVAHLEALSHRYRMRLIRCATDGDWVAALERGLGADAGVRHSRIA